MFVRVVFALLFALSAVIGTVQAGTLRPNALDRSVDAISRTALLAQPATDLADAQRQAAAVRLERYRTPVWLVMLALQIGVLAWFWRSGWAAALRGRLRQALRNEFLVRCFFGAALAAIARLAAILPQFVEYRMWKILEISTESSQTWAGDWLVGTLIAMVIAGAIAGIVLWLADRTHQWYLYTVAAIFGLTLLVAFVNPFTFAPFFARQIPVPSAVGATADALAQQAGLH
ncbi:MAG: hypothetical protein M3R35_06910, partial [Candidatus Eremiobacteraeota bacterium]|nr:hypothetical protein [Candidatus Eremiobacteraeota bacterium]